MSKIKLKIDGEEIIAKDGQTVLEVASDNGIDIPTHCYNGAFEPAGLCRICVVEIKPPNGEFELDAACTFPVNEGLEVRTDTEKVKKSRKLTAELMLARCPNSKAIKELAEGLGVEKTRFPEKNLDCTLCGLCVRACKSVLGEEIITFTGRGTNRGLITPFELSPEECRGCGLCAKVCPTNAIEMIEVEE